MGFRAQWRREIEWAEAREREKQGPPKRTPLDAATDWLSVCMRRASHRFNQSATSRAYWQAELAEANARFAREVQAASDAKLAKEGRVELDEGDDARNARNHSPLYDVDSGTYFTRGGDDNPREL